MTTKDIADIFLFSIERIEFYWNFYVVSILALAGWLASTSVNFSLQFRLLITAGYLALSGMNVLGLVGSYLTVEAVRKDLLHSANKHAADLENTIKILADNSFENRPFIAIAIHVVIGGLFLFAIWKKSEN